jgi:hypothetical protein
MMFMADLFVFLSIMTANPSFCAAISYPQLDSHVPTNFVEAHNVDPHLKSNITTVNIESHQSSNFSIVNIDAHLHSNDPANICESINIFSFREANFIAHGHTNYKQTGLSHADHNLLWLFYLY